jgi:DNA-binding NtrC family response regulator
MNKAKILIADDELSMTNALSAILSSEGYEVAVASDGKKALDQLSGDSFGVVLADLKMPKLDGLALLKELQRLAIPTECIIVTGQGTVDSAVQAMREGAYDYIEKPLNAEKLNRLKALIPKALEKFSVQERNRELSSKLEGLTHFGELTGQSEEMRSVYQIIDAVAPSSARCPPETVAEPPVRSVDVQPAGSVLPSNSVATVAGSSTSPSPSAPM